MSSGSMKLLPWIHRPNRFLKWIGIRIIDAQIFTPTTSDTVGGVALFVNPFWDIYDRRIYTKSWFIKLWGN